MTNPIKLCKKTLEHLKLLLKKTQHDYVRFGVMGGGCNGLKYTVTPDSAPPMKTDLVFSEEGINFHLCGKSLLYFFGTEVKWVTDAFGSRMEFNNPNAFSSCGCGETFDVKKRKPCDI